MSERDDVNKTIQGINGESIDFHNEKKINIGFMRGRPVNTFSFTPTPTEGGERKVARVFGFGCNSRFRMNATDLAVRLFGSNDKEFEEKAQAIFDKYSALMKPLTDEILQSGNTEETSSGLREILDNCATEFKAIRDENGIQDSTKEAFDITSETDIMMASFEHLRIQESLRNDFLTRMRPPIDGLILKPAMGLKSLAEKYFGKAMCMEDLFRGFKTTDVKDRFSRKIMVLEHNLTQLNAFYDYSIKFQNQTGSIVEVLGLECDDTEFLHTYTPRETAKEILDNLKDLSERDFEFITELLEGRVLSSKGTRSDVMKSVADNIRKKPFLKAKKDALRKERLEKKHMHTYGLGLRWRRKKLKLELKLKRDAEDRESHIYTDGERFFNSKRAMNLYHGKGSYINEASKYGTKKQVEEIIDTVAEKLELAGYSHHFKTNDFGVYRVTIELDWDVKNEALVKREFTDAIVDKFSATEVSFNF